MTFNSILDLTFPRVEARWIITYRSSPTGFSRFLLRGGRPLVIRRTSLGSAISSSRHWRTGSTLFQIPTDEHGLYLLCNYFPTRPRQHSSRLFSPPSSSPSLFQPSFRATCRTKATRTRRQGTKARIRFLLSYTSAPIFF